MRIRINKELVKLFEDRKRTIFMKSYCGKKLERHDRNAKKGKL